MSATLLRRICWLWNRYLRTVIALFTNLGNSKGLSVRDVIETARAVTGHPIPAVTSGRRAGDPAVLIANSEKILQGAWLETAL